MMCMSNQSSVSADFNVAKTFSFIKYSFLSPPYLYIGAQFECKSTHFYPTDKNIAGKSAIYLVRTVTHRVKQGTIKKTCKQLLAGLY